MAVRAAVVCSRGSELAGEYRQKVRVTTVTMYGVYIVAISNVDSLSKDRLTTPRRREMEPMKDEPREPHAAAWVARFEAMMQETMPQLRRVAPELSEEALIQLASRLVELRLGGITDLGSEIR
jgi:hypothetical protein